MSDPSTQTARLFSGAMANASQARIEELKKTRYLLSVVDGLERMVTASILRETVGKQLEAKPLPPNPVILFMDRMGGAEGAKAAATIISLIGEQVTGAAFVHIAFATPSRGLGSLMRASLARKGAESGVLVDVIAHTAPAEAVTLSADDADRLLEDCDLVITYAPDGSAGLIEPSECRSVSGGTRLLHRSHVAVLSFPDPEHTVADLTQYQNVIENRPGFGAIRFWVQEENEARYRELGHCTLGPDGDAKERLWVLLDNAKRLPYRILVEPMAHDLPIGLPLHCPCQTILDNGTTYGLPLGGYVKAGSNIVAVSRR